MTEQDIEALVGLGRALRQAGYRFSIVTPATRRRVNGRAGNRHAHDLRGVFGWGRPFAQGTLPADIVQLMQAAGVLSVAHRAGRPLRRRAAPRARPALRALGLRGTRPGRVRRAALAAGLRGSRAHRGRVPDGPQTDGVKSWADANPRS